MAWSKSLTVKEKIILHLLSYSQYSDLEEVPENMTQQGIASSIAAPRPHVSMALKDLKTIGQLTERTSRITQGKRKQKVYLLSSEGVQIGNGLKRRLLDSEIKIIDGSIEGVLRISEVCNKYKISIMDLLNSITDDGFCDIRTIGKKPKPAISPQPHEFPKSTKSTKSQQSQQLQQSQQSQQSQRSLKTPKLQKDSIHTIQPLKPDEHALLTQTKPTSTQMLFPPGHMRADSPKSADYYSHPKTQDNYLNYLYHLQVVFHHHIDADSISFTAISNVN